MEAQQAQAWANPTLSVTAENLEAPQLDGVSQRQDTYTVTQVFEIGGKRASRIEAEQRKADAVGMRERQARVAFANDLAVAYATAEAMQQRKTVADAELARASDDMRAAQALVQAGREAELRLAQARASVAAAQATVQSAIADAIEALEPCRRWRGRASPIAFSDGIKPTGCIRGSVMERCFGLTIHLFKKYNAAGHDILRQTASPAEA